MLVEAQYFRVLAIGAELLRGVNRKQHGLALADIRAKLLAAEFDEPDILLARDQIAPALPVGNECRRLCGLTEPKSQHDVPLSICRSLRRIATHNAATPRVVPPIAT